MLKSAHILFCILIACFISCSNNFKKTQSKYIETPIYSANNESSVSEKEEKYSIGINYINQKQYDNALTFFSELYSENSSDWQTNYYLGSIYTNLKDYSSSEKYLNQSLRYAGLESSRRCVIYIALAFNFENKGEFNKARQHYHTALNLSPESQEAKKSLKRLNTYSQHDK